MTSSIKQVKVETFNLLQKYQGWMVEILRHELEHTRNRIIQAGGVIPDVRDEQGEEIIEARLMLTEIISWVPDLPISLPIKEIELELETELETETEAGSRAESLGDSI
jgi:hypothetical protein